MRGKKNKNLFPKIVKVFIILFVVGIILCGLLFTVNYFLGEETIENSDGTISKIHVKKRRN